MEHRPSISRSILDLLSSILNPQSSILFAFSGDERHLFMADYSTGLFDIDVRTKKVVHLPPLEGATLLGIDGLYFCYSIANSRWGLVDEKGGNLARQISLSIPSS